MPDPLHDPAATAGLSHPPAADPDFTGAYAPGAQAVPLAEAIPDIPGYVIETVLGRGGMGVVYKARQVAANRSVALKMILGGELAGEAERHRLRTEAESIARLNHPNIVQIYEVGEYHGVPFFSLEYCAGGSLAQHLAGSPIASAAAARLVASLAGAVGCAHEAGIVHRDLKPANILLARGDIAAQGDARPGQSARDTRRPGRTSRGGRRGSSAHADGPDDRRSDLLPKVTDFGLAKHLDAGPGQTQSGQVMGTPSYMAPEQALGNTRRVGPAADVYALGAVLYECLTGRPPFRAATTLETLDQVRHREPVPVRDLAPAVPRDLETICLKCLQKDAHRRYASADDLSDDLGRFLEGRPIVARPVGPVERAVKWVRRNRGVSAALASTALALLVGITGTAWSAVIAEERRGFAEQKEALATRREGEARVAEGQAEQRRAEAEAARDAKAAALAREQQALVLKSAALTDREAALARETRTSYARSVTLASLEYGRNNMPAVRKLLNECPAHLRGWEWYYLDRACRAASWEVQAHPPGRTRVRFEPGGRLVTAGMKNLVKVWDANTRAHVADLTGHAGHPFALAAGPGAGFAVTGEFGVRGADAGQGGLDSSAGRVILWDLARKAEAVSVAGTGRWGAWVHSLAGSPDGKRVAVGGGFGTGGKVFVWDARGDGSVKSFDTDKDRPVAALAFTPDGKRLVATSGTALYVFATDTNAAPAVFASSAEEIESLAVAPNSKWIAAGYGNGLIRVYDLDRKAILATFNGHTSMIEDLAFSPDGRWVASASTDGSARVWEITTGNQVFQLRGHAGPVTGVAFHPDGYELVTAGLDGTVRGWDLVLGNEPRTLAQGKPLTAIAGASTRRRLAWATEQQLGAAPAYHVTVFDFDRGEPVLNVPKMASRIMGLALSPDGRLVAIGHMNGEVSVFDIQGTGGQRFKTGISSVTALAFSPDGKTLACNGGLARTLLLDLPGNKRKAELTGHKGSTTSVAFRPNGAEVATGGFDGTVRVWAADGAAVRTLTGHVGAVSSVDYRADGKMIASCGVDGKLRLWDADTGTLLRTLEGHSGQAIQVMFTPDGSRLVSTGSDGVLRCWDPDYGEALLQLTGAFGPQDRISWVGSDGALACGSGQAVLLWQKTPLPLGEMIEADKLLLWHSYAADAAKADRNWFTVDYHLNWLIPRYAEKHPRLYDDRGQARLAMGRVADALDDYQAAAKKGYTEPRLFLRTATAFVVQRKWDKAEAALDEFLKHRPDDPLGLYWRAMLGAYAGPPADARTHQRALRRVTAAEGRELTAISLWLDAVVPDPMADTSARLAEAAKLAEKNPRRGFYRSVYALWLYRAGRAEGAVEEAQKALNYEGNEAKLLATTVVILAGRKLGRADDIRLIRETLEETRKSLLVATPEQWVTSGDPAEWPMILSFLMLTAEYDRAGRPAPPPIPPAD